MEHELTRFPPILQLLGLALLGTYVLLSIVGRLWDRPALILCVATAAVGDPEAPLRGGWTARQLVLGPLAALAGLLLVAESRRARRAEFVGIP